LKIEANDFDLATTIRGHGWCDLAPFRLVDDETSLEFAFESAGGPVAVSVRQSQEGLVVRRIGGGGFGRDATEVRRVVRRVLRLDEDITTFHRLIARDKRLKWIAEAGAGRLLRSPSVFEDIVKTICTTNCTWSLTRAMVNNLVETLGVEAAGGYRTFPNPETMADRDEKFFRERIKAGYRSAYLLEFARSVAEGRCDPEAWMESGLSEADLRKELMGIKGVGKYAAENLLKLLGCYEGLALDSYLRSEFYERHNKGDRCDDRAIEEHYEGFGEWRGLVIWFEMSEKWLRS